MTVRERERRRSAAEQPPLPSRFVLRRCLGVGSFGTVWEAFDRERGHNVALKTLHQVDAVVLYRFKHEFRTFADIVHPNLVALHEMFCFQDRWFFTMDLVEGEPFLRFIRRVSSDYSSSSDANLQVPDRNAPTESCLPLITELTTPFDEARLRTALFGLVQGVFALQIAGKVHRDLKPSNVLVTQDGHVVLLDFGMIRVLKDEDPHITVRRQVLGTPAYMSPEQAAGLDLSPASDWYSVGVMLFEALTLARPHRGTTTSIFIKKQTLDAPDPRKLVPTVPADLASLTMDLLRRDPLARPSGREILQRLDEKSVITFSFKHENEGENRRFFGRTQELSFLHEHLKILCAKQAAILLIHGPSGIGKTALIAHFLDGLKATNDQVVVLRTRCSEQESVPLKAVDGLVDSLTRYLITLAPETVERLIPTDYSSILRIFPVLARVPTLGNFTQLPSLAMDLDEARMRAFDALKQMLAALSRMRLLVVHVDDLQWADLESAKALRELLLPPFPMVALLIESYRTGGLAPNEALELLMTQDGADRRVAVGNLAVGALSLEERKAFALSLMDRSDPEAQRFASTIAHESLGNPFFVRELVRQYLHHPEPEDRDSLPPEIRLDHVISKRIASLSPNERRLLETISASECPISLGCLGKAAETGNNLRECLSKLRGEKLVLTRGQRDQDPVIVSHELVRQAALRSLSADQLRDRNRALALALSEEPIPNLEALAYCYQGTGDKEQTHKHATIAANRAYDTGAFDRAVVLYRMALRACSDSNVTKTKEQLGDALAAVGRRPEAATMYFDAMHDAPKSKALRLQQKAASHLLKAGHFDEGIENARVALAQTGMSLPTNRFHLAALTWYRRTRLAMRGLEAKLKDRAEVDETRIKSWDFFNALALGLSQIDPMLAFELHTRGLLEALDTGEASRLFRGLLLEACFLASEGLSSSQDVKEVLRKAATVAKQSGLDNERDSLLSEAVIAFQTGRFRKAFKLAESAEQALLLGKGETWELVASRNYATRSLAYLGRYKELIRRVRNRLQVASDKGDLYSATALSTGMSNLCWLVLDDVEGARAAAESSLGKWSRAGFHLQHFAYFLGNAHIELYEGEPRRALKRVEGIERSLYKAGLMRLQHVRTEYAYLRARICLAVSAKDVSIRQRCLGIAWKDWSVLRRETGVYAQACALQIEAGIRQFGGDPKKSLAILEKAIRSFAGQHMDAHAQALRIARGKILGEGQGDREVERGTAWMEREGVKIPERICRVLAPGI